MSEDLQALEALQDCLPWSRAKRVGLLTRRALLLYARGRQDERGGPSGQVSMTSRPKYVTIGSKSLSSCRSGIR